MRNAKSRAHNSDCFSLIFEEIYLKHLQIYGLLNLSCPWRTSHCSTNASSFTINSSMPLLKTRHGVSNARRSPRGTQMPSPRPWKNCQCPQHRDWQCTMWKDAPRLPGEGDGPCWFNTTWRLAASLVEIILRLTSCTLEETPGDI